jgi:parvulin-like peptidyl-prolyl isomerase
MTKRKFLAIFAAIALAGVVAIVGVALVLHPGSSQPTAEPMDLGPVIATVDGRPIYLGLARARVEGLAAVHGDIEQTMGANWQKQVLESLVDDQLIEEEADRRGLSVSDADLRDHVDRLKTQFGSEQAFQDWLDSQNMDLAELERRIELQSIAALVYQAVTADVTVSGGEMRDYYRSHQTDFQNADGSIPSLLEVRTSVRQALLKQQQDEAFTAWIEDQRKKADVVVLVDDWWRDLT